MRIAAFGAAAALVAAGMAGAAARASVLSRTAAAGSPSHVTLASRGGAGVAVRDAQKAAFHALSLRSIENGLMSGDDECMQETPDWMDTLVSDEKSLNANTATVDMPYDVDPSAYGWCRPTDPERYESMWVDAISAACMHVWYRQNLTT